MLEHIVEWNRYFQAKKWKKQNASFISSWHAYVGYKAMLFERFSQGGTVAHIAQRYELDPFLLQQWAEVGVEVGHLHKSGEIFMTSSIMRQYFSSDNDEENGNLLKEMMEVYIPTLLRFPELLKAQPRNSSLSPRLTPSDVMLETLAYPKISQWVRRKGAKTILDLGCGRAVNLIRLARRYRKLKLIGIEQNLALVKRASKAACRYHGGRIELVHGDIRSWKGPKEPVDLIMLNNILHDVKPQERELLLKKAREFLSKKGSVSIITPIRRKSGDTFLTDDFNSFTPVQKKPFPFPSEKELANMAAANGLSIVSQMPLLRESDWYFVTME
ncbi:class I SAM-dependent methyltransferase [Paenibacillus nasutitermitis]|uniref:Methyltransferase domain-containing protein n=1 Tax=Paenibacillus nasutitermitis TaxID=1652958 RepID=A0A916YPX1_9BACL|nr:class I SAM-dependent methyltransferase [Paenibacillus nasutitermitis]GGD54789.1 hypothetical protein GCM10010911_10560 [Paenibacillus nasutitermitis]